MQECGRPVGFGKSGDMILLKRDSLCQEAKAIYDPFDPPENWIEGKE